MNNKWSFPPPAFDVLIRQCRAYPQGTEFTPKTPSLRGLFAGRTTFTHRWLPSVIYIPLERTRSVAGGGIEPPSKGLWDPSVNQHTPRYFKELGRWAGLEPAGLRTSALIPFLFNVRFGIPHYSFLVSTNSTITAMLAAIKRPPSNLLLKMQLPRPYC